ncbi:hypothetical protein B0T14DRAFT_499699 [Immersiella caudata]|uniref:Uncharacterized protein n=1 Tax=Immersiella caudata TaxID=314043 RepID=A0AA39WFH6_9PEZI|nr:hypothetical protein B0T14DRAFT_499699 [Immersiella caudata]
MPDGRYNLSLSTDKESATNGKTFKEYYDQVCALSQGAINRNFEQAFAILGDEKKTMPLEWFEGDITEGKIKARMDPPHILLDFDNATPFIWYKLRFRSGLLVTSSSDEGTDLTGWEIAVSANLDEMTVSEPPKAGAEIPQDPKAAAAARKAAAVAARALEELNKTHEFLQPVPVEAPPTATPPNQKVFMKPGEYSIHRLFAAINSVKWGLPNTQLSTCPGPNGTRIKLDDWAEADDDNERKYTKLKSVITNWATAHRLSAFFTLGLQVRVPQPEDNPLPTFVPKHLYLQTYPYWNEQEIQSYQPPKEFPLKGIRDRDNNCLVYCETCESKLSGKERDLPEFKRLPFTANLSEPAVGGRGGFDGSFVIDHRLFMHQHILPILQDLCRAWQVIPLRPEMRVDDDRNDQFNPRFAFGGMPDDPEDKARLPDPNINRGDYTNDFFAFKYISPGTYQWSDYIIAPGSRSDPKGKYTHNYSTCKQAPFYRQYEISASMDVTVTWEPLASKFKITGGMKYNHYEVYCSNPDFNRNCYWGEFETLGSWSLGLELERTKEAANDPILKNGVIQPRITGVNPDTNLPADIKIVPGNMKYVLHDANVKISKNMADKLKSIVGTMDKTLVGRCASAGQFTYPGAGELVFGKPMLSARGDLVADITYAKHDGSRISVRPPGLMKYEKPKPVQSKPVAADPILRVDKELKPAHLVWSGSLAPVNGSGSENRQHFRLVATNASIGSGALGFKRLVVTFVPIAKSDNKPIFKEKNPLKWGDLNAIPKPEPKKPEPEKPEPKKPDEGKDQGPSEEAAEGKDNSADAPPSNPPTGKLPVITKPSATSKPPAAKPPVAKPPVAKPPVAKPPPANTWTVKCTNMPSTTLRARPEEEGAVFKFFIEPTGKDEDGKAIKKFRMEPTAFITLDLEGEVNPLGSYQVKLTEIWTDPNVEEEFGDPDLDGSADYYFKVGVQMGMGDVVPMNALEVLKEQEEGKGK